MIITTTRTILRSNIRLLDATNRPRQLIDRAIELGLAGIGFSEHESLGSHVELDRLQEEYKEKYPDFKIVRGNEIYLTKDRSSGQQYYHHILIALDSLGHKMLRELSSQSWIRSYFDRGERVPTLKQEVEAVIEKYGKDHIYASTACFIEGTKVLTPNGYIPIEDIRSGDIVINRFGQKEEIIYPTRIDYKGAGYQIRTKQGNYHNIVCTADHKFLAMSQNEIFMNKNSQKTYYPKWYTAEEIWQNREQYHSKTGKRLRLLFPIPQTSYTENNMLKKEEWQNRKRQKEKIKYSLPEKIIITPELMRLFGYFLGDGCLGNKSVKFSVHSEEFLFFWEDFFFPVSQQLGFEWYCYHYPNRQLVDIYGYSAELVDLFSFLFSDNVRGINKFIPCRLLHISKELDIELLFGYLLADGHFEITQKDFYRKKYDSGKATFCTISEKLGANISELLWSLNIPNSLRIDRTKRERKKHIAYIGAIYDNIIGKIKKRRNWSHAEILEIFNQLYNKYNQKIIFITEQEKYFPISVSSMAQQELDTQVFCLQNKTHSFVCEGVVVHNCLGGELDSKILQLHEAEIIGNAAEINQAHRDIVNFLLWCKNTYGDNNFSLEVQPARSEEQLIVNKRMGAIAKAFDLPICVTCDSHYLRKEDRYVHKALLNSKEGDREVDSFYAYAYLQSEEEIRENLKGTGLDYEELCANSMKIYDRCEYYTLHKNQHIVEVSVPEYPIEPENHHFYDKEKYPTLDKLMHSQNPQERYWINECQNELNLRHLSPQHLGSDIYLERLEEEADIQDVIGQKLGTCMFAYPIFLRHYINLFWECGSTVGAGRGSACSGLNHFLLGITQLDPIKNNLPYWRYLNKERQEIGDIDIDLCPSKREYIFQKIREERGQLGCVQVCTYGTISTKAAIKIAARGYRSNDCPDGIELDEAEYLSSLIPQERGFLYSLSDCFYGNKRKDRKPSYTFIQQVEKYPGLKEILLGIEGLISQRGIHASGVNFYGEDPYETACFMKAKNGSIITQYSLHNAEYCGDVKYDFLLTEVQEVITQCINLLQENGQIDKNLTLREAYDKYLAPEKLPIEDDKLWKAASSGTILKFFQFDTQVGGQTIKMVKPHTPQEMADCNSAMRLMATEKGGETPTERYIRMKNDISQWYTEMRQWHLSQEEQKILEPHYLPAHAAPAQQEQMMLILMDENICRFTLAEANQARKIVGKFCRFR